MAARKQMSFQIISTKMHGMLDIAFVLIFFATPYLLGFANGGAAQFSMQALGLVALVASMLTRYETGLYGLIPMPMHLAFDFAAGVYLIVAPFVFGFYSTVMWPYIILGVLGLATGVMTKTQPQRGAIFA